MAQFCLNHSSSEDEAQSPVKIAKAEPPLQQPDAKQDEPPQETELKEVAKDKPVEAKQKEPVQENQHKQPGDDATTEQPKKRKRGPARPLQNVPKQVPAASGEDKSSKPRSSDKQPRTPRGEGLTFAGHRPPKDAQLREAFMKIRESYMSEKLAFKGKSKRAAGNWTPHVRQLDYLQFMKQHIQENTNPADNTTQKKFKSACAAWKDHCQVNGWGCPGSSEHAETVPEEEAAPEKMRVSD